MKRISILLLAALLACTGCNKGLDNGPRTITVTAGIGTLTRVAYDGDKTSFTDGDKISVYAWTGSAASVKTPLVVDGVVNTFDGSKWTPASQMLWDDKSTAHYFLGIYPVREVTDFTADAYTLDPANYEASDLLIATNLSGLTSADGPVPLVFDHALAKLVVNLSFRSQWETAPTVSAVQATARKSSSVNYLTKTVSASGNAEAVALVSSANNAWSGLQVPQEGVRKVTVTIDNKDFVYESGSDIPLTAGQYTTLNLLVGRDKIELGSISVNDWTAGTTLPDGDALEPDPYNGHAYVDLGLSVKWATCNVGATTPEGYGDHFAWGETAEYNSSTYFDENYTEYTVGGKTVLDSEDDAATANWGSPWRMPTLAEWKELVDNCNTVWATQNGVNGRLFTSNKNGATLFLPAAGWTSPYLYDAGSVGDYWSSSLYLDSPDRAYYVFFDSSGVNSKFIFRNIGSSVRPVTE